MKALYQFPVIKLVPDSYTPQKQYPTVVFLHGVAGKGMYFDNLLSKEVPAAIKAAVEKYQIIVLVPQTYSEWNQKEVDNVLQHSGLSIDFDNLYITGLSLGGGGVIRTLSTTTERFKAALICCPVVVSSANYTKIANSGIRLRFFHAANDTPVPPTATHTHVAKLLAANPEMDVEKTIFPTGGHGIWNTVFGNLDNWEWLLKDRQLEGKPLPVPEPDIPEPLPLPKPEPLPDVPALKANAGMNRTINTPSVILDASGSTGTGLKFLWKRKAGQNVFIKSSGSIKTEVTGYPRNAALAKGIYIFHLIVTDSNGHTDSDDVQIIVE